MSKREEGLEEIYNRPGFLLRRCHQISVAVFLEECEAFDLTPAQFGVLTALESAADIDQIGVARLLGMDRTTVSNVVNRLEGRDLIKRIADPTDKRKWRLKLTARGRQIRREAAGAAARASDRLLAGLSPAQRKQFLALLARIDQTADGSPRAELVRQA